MSAVLKERENTLEMPAEAANDPHGAAETDAKRSRFLMLWDIGVLIAVLIVFLIFLNLLVRIVFPHGSRLVDGVGEIGTTAVEAGDRGTADISGGLANLGEFMAQLGDVHREVKIRPADSIVWSGASKGAQVRNRDAVQTFSNSRARVDFVTDNKLQIGQNSLIVFNSGATDPFLVRREPAVIVMDGELVGQVNAGYGAFGVEFPSGLVELTADETLGETVNFRVGVNPDASSTIAVYSGRADVNLAGEHYSVAASQGITIRKDGTTSGVTDLPSMSVLRQPGKSSTFRYLQIPPRVNFAWSRTKGALKYRFEIARDLEFERILVDEILDGNTFTHGNLTSGRYYWRVSAMAGWVQGPATPARRFDIVRDARPPDLDLERIEREPDDSYVLRGVTNRNAKVFVLGEPVPVSADGRFEYRFYPQPGTQSVVVESIDAVGNAAYSSQVLQVPGNSGRSE